MNGNGRAVPGLQSVARCKSDTSTLLEMRRKANMNRKWSWSRRDSSKESASTMPALSGRNS